jgi:glutathione synthase
MKLAIAVNDINTELAGYTTTHLAMEATNMGHEVWYINVSDFIYDPDENVHAHACSVPNTEHNKRFRSTTTYLNTLRGKTADKTRITIEDLDVLLLRNDPAEDVVKRPWARLTGINFGRLAMRHGVIVLNDPNGLALAVNKMYLQYFPEHVRPRTLISRNREDIKHFIKEQGGFAVLKPLAGSGGRNVFLIDPHEGKPLQSKGHYAAIHRVRETEDGDMRSNMMAGAVARKAQINDSMLQLAETVRPKLIQDGMFFVGMDIVGDKLMEINVFSPGGIDNASKLEGVNFTREVIHSLEHKVEAMHRYHRNFDNVELATL